MASRAATSTDITAKDLRVRLFLLADDSMGGREPGSIGNFKAAEYIASEFKRLGLKPGGEGSTYFQQVPFVREQLDDQASLEGAGVKMLAGRDFIPALWIPSRTGPLAGGAMAAARLVRRPGSTALPLQATWWCLTRGQGQRAANTSRF
jgi:hypothetical protein